MKKKLGYWGMLRNIFEASLYSLMVLNAPGWIVLLILLFPLFLITIPLSFIAIIVLLPCIFFVFPFVSLFLYRRDKDIPLLWVFVFAVITGLYFALASLSLENERDTIAVGVFAMSIHGGLMGWAMWWQLFGGIYRDWNIKGMVDRKPDEPEK